MSLSIVVCQSDAIELLDNILMTCKMVSVMEKARHLVHI